MLPLAAFGPRIVIIGASNGGKSTLADALSRKLGIPAIHLDQLYHLPNTDWQPRPQQDFVALHDTAIAGESWVVEGNYAIAMPQRLARATGLIWLDTAALPSGLRYIRRTLMQGSHRVGALQGAPERLKWSPLSYILFEQPRKRAKYAALLAGCDFPQLRLKSLAEIKACYRHWDLTAAL
ncbi:MAG TPA: AAA family ATPase [Devosia sp.]|nr:AAA family ATPase [Devosia sp.]